MRKSLHPLTIEQVYETDKNNHVSTKPNHALLKDYLTKEWKVSKLLIIKILTQLNSILSNLALI